MVFLSNIDCPSILVTGNATFSSSITQGSVISSMLKANGSGTLVAAVAGDITDLISGTYLPLSGGTLTGALNGTSLSMSGNANALSYTLSDWTAMRWVSTILQVGGFNASQWQNVDMYANASHIFRFNQTTNINYNALQVNGALNGTSAAFSGAGLFGTSTALSGIAGGIATNSATSSGMNMRVSDVNKGYVYVSGSDVLMEGAASMNVKLLTTSGYYYNLAPSGLATSNAIRTLFNTTTDNGTDALQVAGSGLFSSSVTALGGNFNTSAGGSSLILANTGAQNSNGLEIRGGTAGTTVNWKIEKDNTLSQNLQFTPSTANGGTSFTTPVLSLSSTGAITASSSVTANSFVKSGGTSAQFLKADGSVDGSTYLTSAGAVTSIAGTTNQITVSASTGAVTVSLPSAVTISGAMNASSFFETSDLRKKDIVSVTKQADGIDFVGFKWKKELNLDNRKHLGVIAQQVEKVIPDAVTTDEKGFKSVNYTEVMLYKLEKLTEKVSELEKELKKLKTKKLKN